MKHVTIIGGGAAGMMAAIAAAREGARVTVLEGMNRPGRKLLLTGNGSCNLTTADPDYQGKYHSFASGDILPSFVKTVFGQMDRQGVLQLFADMGLLCRAKGEYIYPMPETAEAVLRTLMNEMQRLGVKIRTDTKALSLTWKGMEEARSRDEDLAPKGSWSVGVDGWTYDADCVVLACGSKAYPGTGSDGSGYLLARQAGHSCTRTVPALTGLLIKDPQLKNAAGCRCMARVSAVIDGNDLYSDYGQVQWNKDGISGIVVMQLSGRIAKAVSDGRQVSVILDLVPETEEKDLVGLLENWLTGRNLRFSSDAFKPGGQKAAEMLLQGLVNERLFPLITAQADSYGRDKDGVAKAQILAHVLKHLCFPVAGVRGFEQAQVCSGGIPLAEVNAKTMESKCAGGLYLAGEMLDVDGPCGGYNLQWAWSTGYIAGREAAR